MKYTNSNVKFLSGCLVPTFARVLLSHAQGHHGHAELADVVGREPTHAPQGDRRTHSNHAAPTCSKLNAVITSASETSEAGGRKET